MSYTLQGSLATDSRKRWWYPPRNLSRLLGTRLRHHCCDISGFQYARKSGRGQEFSDKKCCDTTMPTLVLAVSLLPDHCNGNGSLSYFPRRNANIFDLWLHFESLWIQRTCYSVRTPITIWLYYVLAPHWILQWLIVAQVARSNFEGREKQ